MVDEERAAEAFGTLGDATRVAILLTFAEVMDEEDLPRGMGMPALSFSELYDRVDVDSTSQLSYHLNELDGLYLRQVEEGWTFTFAGNAIVRLVLSGAYAGGIEFDPVEVPGECPFCERAELLATVEDRALVYECQACGEGIGATPVTTAQVRDRDPESLLDSTTTRTVEMIRQFRNGVCSQCGGIADVSVHTHPAGGDAPERLRYIASGRCRQCWWNVNAPPPMWLASHPAAVAFHWDQGIDVLSVGARDIGDKLGDQWHTERVDTDPDEYEITYEVGANALRLTVADDLSLLRTERVRRDSTGER